MAKVGLLATVAYAYEPITGPLREIKQHEAEEARRQLEEWLGDEVVFPGLVAGTEDGTNASRQFAAEGVYAVVLYSTIAAMAAYPWSALEGGDWPVVLWSRTGWDPLPTSTAEQVSDTAGIGSMAIGNVLARHRRAFVSTNGPALSRRALAFLRGARAARRLRGAALGHAGGPSWPGMLDVELDRARLESAIGLRIVDLELNPEIPPIEPETLPAEALDATAEQRSRLLAGQLEEAVQRQGVIGGTLVCHGPQMAKCDAVGVVGCLGVNRLTSRGIPFSCTGDDCVAVALVLGTSLGGAVQYAEMDAVMERHDAVMISSGGEGDLRMARHDPPPRLCPNRLFGGKAGYGTAHDFQLQAGEATLINFTPIGDTFRLVVAEGRILSEAPPNLGVPRCLFQFNLPAREAYDLWCEAGVNHHLALTPGLQAFAVQTFAELNGLEFVKVC